MSFVNKWLANGSESFQSKQLLFYRQKFFLFPGIRKIPSFDSPSAGSRIPVAVVMLHVTQNTYSPWQNSLEHLRLIKDFDEVKGEKGMLLDLCSVPRLLASIVGC